MEKLFFEKKGSWVCVPNKEKNTRTDLFETAYFKKNITLYQKVTFPIYITANSRYKLYINGEYILSGPCKSYAQSKICEQLDIGKYLKVGTNTIIVKVVAFPPAIAVKDKVKGPDWSFNFSCGAQLFVYGEAAQDDEPISITTGISDWECISSNEMMPRHDVISQWLGYMEMVNGGESPNTSDDSLRWEKAENSWLVEENLFGIIFPFELYSRPIPLLYQKKCQFKGFMPIQPDDLEEVVFDHQNQGHVKANTSAVFELNAGELTTGYFRIKLTGGAGACVKIIYSEAYSCIVEGDRKNPLKLEKRVRDDYENGILTGHYDLFYPAGDCCEYEPFLFRTFRFVRVEITTKDEPLTVFMPTYLETGYPLQSMVELYEDNEQWVKDIWDISLRTLQRCMHETHEDCPYYEQMQYTMDTRLQMLFVHAIANDTRMSKKTIFDYHSSLLPNGMLQSRFPSEVTQIITPFALDYIFMINDYYLQTGDKTLLCRYRPTIEAILGYYERKENQDGLVEKLGYWENIDWVPEWEQFAGVPEASIYSVSSIQNFKYAYALKITAKLMSIIELYDLERMYQNKCNRIQQVLIKTCYDEKRGLFKEAHDMNSYSEHAQVWAVLSGIEDQLFQQNIMEHTYYASDLYRCRFPQLFYMFRAYETAGLYLKTEKFWDYWKQLLDYHLTTVPEVPEKTRSDCHAWGSLMLYEYPKKILGVDFDLEDQSITIEPKAIYIKKAHGKVPTPLGEVTVKYLIENHVFNIEVQACNCKNATLIMPDGAKYTLKPNVLTSYTCIVS